MAVSKQSYVTFARGLYPFAGMMFLMPLVEVVRRVFPMHLHNVEWRFGLVGLVFANTGTILLGFVLLGAVAAVRENQLVLRILAVLAMLGAVAMLAATGMFTLDWLQVRGLATNVQSQGVVQQAGISSLMAALLGVVSLAGIGIGAWIAARQAERGREKSKSSENSLIFYSRNSADEKGVPQDVEQAAGVSG